MVRAAAATEPPARVTAADDPSAPAANPTASPAANNRKGSRRAGRQSTDRGQRRRDRGQAQRHQGADPQRRERQVHIGEGEAAAPPRWYRHSVVRTGALVMRCQVGQVWRA